jgi:hypothetical protein
MWAVLFVLLILNLPFGYSQPLKTKASFDMSFWRKELRLTNMQVRQIRFINFDFYNALLDMHASPSNSDVRNYQVLLDLWTVATADVLKVRQRKKWQKILAAYSSEYSPKKCAL